MNWFCKHSVCAVCKVHFEPVPEGSLDRLWPNMCETHRQEPRDKYLRRQAVQNWAEINFERLEKQMLKEREEELAKQAERQQSILGGLYGQAAGMQAAMRQRQF